MAGTDIGGLECDVAAFVKDVNAVAARYNITADDIVRGAHAAWGIDLLRRSPPYPKGFAGSGKPPSQSAAKKAGYDRVEKDIAKVIVNIDAKGSRPDQRELQIAGNRFYRFRNKAGGVYGVDRFYWDPGASARRIHSFHQRARLSNGRVSEAGSFTKDIGRWKFIDKLHVSGAAFRAYVKEVQRNVGSLKEGWLPAVEKWGVGHLVPAWVRKSGRRVGGYASKPIKPDGTGFYESSNAVPYASQKLARIIPWTKRMREQELYFKIENLARRVAKMMSAKSGIPAELGKAA